ncbi:MAG: hypothetical protein Q4D90_09300 [bacterium]|nr:hypothetical protein [bacterium]
MGHHLVVDGNAVYEIDEECIKRRMEGRKTGRDEACRELWIQTGKEVKSEAKSS